MHTFALRRRSCWVARALGRNPLLRPTDRVEACVILVAILLALVAAPVCAAGGVAVYGSRARLYAEQAQTRLGQLVDQAVVDAARLAFGRPAADPKAGR